jgi:ribosomal protein L30E
MKIEIRTFVENGILKRNRNLIIEAIRSFDGKELIISFEKPKKKRSNGQNRFYYGVVLPIVQNCLKEAGHIMNLESTHDLIKMKFLKEIILTNEETGEVVERIKSTSELSTSQFMDFISEIRTFTLDYFNTDIPEPNQEITLNFDR